MEQTPESQTLPEPEGIPFVIKDPYNFEPECPLPRTALTCLNGLKHGATARMLFIPGEQPQDFYTLLAECFATHQPATSEDATLVTDAVLARWFLWRRQRAYSKREFEIYNEGDQEDSPSPSGLRELELFDRYRIQAERSLKRALTNVQNLKKTAASEQKWRAQHELQKAKVDLERQRFELRQAQDARTAPKIEAEAKVAARRANEHLATLDVIDKIGTDPAPVPVPDPDPNLVAIENGVSVIPQLAWISERNGPLTVVLNPSNQAVQEIIANRDRYPVPPQRVSRVFSFDLRLVPNQYEWVVKNLNPDTRAALNQRGQCVRGMLSFESWQELAEEEALLLPLSPPTRKDAA